jgi:uncharacterized protein YjbI with pentapeptide repeats
MNSEEKQEKRKITQKELDEILEKHKNWVDSEKQKGRQANFLNCDLSNKDLQDSELREIKGLSSEQLRGSNLSGAKLPEDIQRFDGLKTVEEASKNARKLFFGTLLGCAFTLLTIATTTDLGLITNSHLSSLPIIRAEIPIVLFYWVTPFLLLGINLYFHLYLQRLWEHLAKLPAIFPDGRSLHEKVYPWMMNGLVCTYFKLLKENRPQLLSFQNAISIMLAWWSVPTTLFFLWLRYLPKHDFFWTEIHLIIFVISILNGILFFHITASTLKGEERSFSFWRITKIIVFFLMMILFSMFLHSLSIEAVYGDHINDTWAGINDTWAGKFFNAINYWPYLNLQDIDVSIKPSNWTGEDENEIKQVKGAKLKGANLRFGSLQGAFLVKADLREADLEGANLNYADLREAIFWDEKQGSLNQKKANLKNAELRKADLRKAILPHVDLSGVNLHNANLSGADFCRADLSRANLENANLSGADLEEADLSGTILNVADLDEINLSGAIFSEDTKINIKRMYLANILYIKASDDLKQKFIKKGAVQLYDYRIWEIMKVIDEIEKDEEWEDLLDRLINEYDCSGEIDEVWDELQKHVEVRFDMEWSDWLKENGIKESDDWRELKRAVEILFPIKD